MNKEYLERLQDFLLTVVLTIGIFLIVIYWR